MIESAARRIRLVAKDAALSRRRSRVRLPYALFAQNLRTPSRLKPLVAGLEPMHNGQRDGLYSNGHDTLPHSASLCAFSVSRSVP